MPGLQVDAWQEWELSDFCWPSIEEIKKAECSAIFSNYTQLLDSEPINHIQRPGVEGWWWQRDRVSMGFVCPILPLPCSPMPSTPLGIPWRNTETITHTTGNASMNPMRGNNEQCSKWNPLYCSRRGPHSARSEEVRYRPSHSNVVTGNLCFFVHIRLLVCLYPTTAQLISIPVIHAAMQRELSGGCIGEVLVVPKHIMGPGSENWSAQPAGQVLQTAPVTRESLLCWCCFWIRNLYWCGFDFIVHGC